MGTFSLSKFSYTFKLVISFPGKIIHALSITFFNSLTFPGQLCFESAVIASGVKTGSADWSKFDLNFLATISLFKKHYIMEDNILDQLDDMVQDPYGL